MTLRFYFLQKNYTLVFVNYFAKGAGRMKEYLDVFINGYTGYAGYLWYEITHPTLHNYFYWLIAISVFFMVLEWVKPWRKGQPKFRKDFWIDAFYMFFNFFLFSLIVYNGVSDVIVKFLNNALQSLTGLSSFTLDPLNGFPYWSILLIGFFVRDFVQWNTHRLLHATPRLWEFHKVHHSVKEMGFAAHLRYHWMETILYRTIEYLPLALLGIGLYDFFIIHLFSLAIGHHNHANFKAKGAYKAGVLGLLVALFIVDQTGMELINSIAWILGMPIVFGFAVGPWMKYIFNSPEMHIWHHVSALPTGRNKGINFAISLSIWDYLFGTAVIPEDGRDIELGFPGIEEFPESFTGQFTHGVVSKKK